MLVKRKDWIGYFIYINLFYLALFLLISLTFVLKLVFWNEFFSAVHSGLQPYNMLDLGEKYMGGPVYQVWLDELSKPKERCTRSDYELYSNEVFPYFSQKVKEKESEYLVNNMLKIVSSSSSLKEVEEKIDNLGNTYFNVENPLDQYLRLMKWLEARQSFLWRMDTKGLESFLTDLQGKFKSRSLLDGSYSFGMNLNEEFRHNINFMLYLPYIFMVKNGLVKPTERNMVTYDDFAVAFWESQNLIERTFPMYKTFREWEMDEERFELWLRTLSAPMPFIEKYRELWVNPDKYHLSSYLKEIKSYHDLIRFRMMDYYLERAERKYFYQISRVFPDLYKFDVKEKGRFDGSRLSWLRRLKRYRIYEMLSDYGVKAHDNRPYAGWRIGWKKDRKGNFIKNKDGKGELTVIKYAHFVPEYENDRIIWGKRRAVRSVRLEDPRIVLRRVGEIFKKKETSKHFFFWKLGANYKIRTPETVEWWLRQQKESLEHGYQSHEFYGENAFYRRFHWQWVLKHKRAMNRLLFPKSWPLYSDSYGMSMYFLKDYVPSFGWHWDSKKGRFSRSQFTAANRKYNREFSFERLGWAKLNFLWSFYLGELRRKLYFNQILASSDPNWLKGPYHTSLGNLMRKRPLITPIKDKQKSDWIDSERSKGWSSFLTSAWKRYFWHGERIGISFQKRVFLGQWLNKYLKHIQDYVPQNRKPIFPRLGKGWFTSFFVPPYERRSWSWLFSYIWNGFWLEAHFKTYLVVISSTFFYFIFELMYWLSSQKLFWFLWVVIQVIGLCLLIFLVSNLNHIHLSLLTNKMNEREFEYWFFKTFYQWKDSIEWNQIGSSWRMSNWYLFDRSYYSMYGKALFHFGRQMDGKNISKGIIRLLFFFWILNLFLGFSLFYLISTLMFSLGA